MRITAIVVTLGVMSLAIGALPVGAEGLSLGGCTELWVSVDSEMIQHPKMLQTAYLVMEKMSPTYFQLRYKLTRYDELDLGPALVPPGKLIGQVTIYRDNAVFYQSPRERELTNYSQDWASHSNEAVVGWEGVTLEPGDVVLFTARFRNMPVLWSTPGYDGDQITLSGEIYDQDGN